jgi:hypothetical protein
MAALALLAASMAKAATSVFIFKVFMMLAPWIGI